MTTTYDPFHPKYFDEADLREEMVRVYDLCHGCRLCFKFCGAFPTMFEAIDRHDDQDSARMTSAEQDQVVDECFNCKLCYVNCPYIPGQHEWALDFPRLMLRSEQVLHRARKQPVTTRLTDQALGRTDLAGRSATKMAPLANKAIGTPGSMARKAMEKVTGIAAAARAPAVREDALLDMVEAPVGLAVRAAAGHGHPLPDVPRRVPDPAGREGPRAGAGAQRDRVRAPAR